ncbi:DNA invertase Pin-like site-specific DNA recombinase [Methanococcus voltae]|uniref:DNA invertase Pin-like site-specific DNA recombinase n=1 Tax=Methanococcus voltae TaxID=2188 RepID=A0A8J7S2K7_METVO|nr:recombinase family protein [Methanococcus voltae]MBP2202175.1 DNA invertase Pin-like site-specific DNA recombinase [Methanococcus voltae]
MIIGYARVSTKEQNIEKYIEELERAGCEKIYFEKISGGKSERPEFNKMMETIRENDIVVVSDLTRLSRSMKDLINTMELFKSRGVQLKSLKESWIDTTTAQGELMFNIFSALAEFERKLIKERTKNGLDVARSRGRVGGRPRVDKSKLEMAIKLYNSGNCTLNEIKNITGISKTTLYRYLEK